MISAEQKEELLKILCQRFGANTHRHKDIRWEDVVQRLINRPDKLWSLWQMEQTGGEPDVVGYDAQHEVYLFMDCSAESPTGRRSLCYDRQAWEVRKANKPTGNAIDMAADMGIEILTEQEYRYLQQFGNFDSKTSSWLKTPDNIRKLGGALFGDRRYDTVFIYHNGAESYYAARGFRGKLEV